MLEGVVKFPPEFAQKYREKGYWEDRTIASHFADWFAEYADRTAIIDGDTVVTETVAIALYLADKYKDTVDLAPGIDDPRRGEYLRWIVFQAASIEPAMYQAGMKFETNQRSAGWGNVQLVAKVLEDRLSLAQPYLFGDWFTAADLIVGGAVNWAIQFGMFPKTPAMSAYAQRMTERPAFQRAFATQNS